MLRTEYLAAVLVACSLACPAPARAAPPPPRPRAEVEAVLSRSPGPPPLERQRPLRIVLLANEKDHGPDEHDYPLWQKRWSALFGAIAAGEDGRTSLYGPAPAGAPAGIAATGAGSAAPPGVSVTTAWGWPEKDVLTAADVVVAFIGTGGRWNRERIADLDAILDRGGGFVAIHSSCITSRDLAPELAARLGLAWQDGTTTFRHGPLDLEVRALEHPVCLGLPTTIRFVDETYWPLVGDREKVDVLATADERPPAGGGPPAPQPMIWTFQRGKGRVFASILGHYTWTFDDPYFRILLLRGTAWAARESPFRFDPLVVRGARLSDGESIATPERKRKPVPPKRPDPKDERLLLWLDASDLSTLSVGADGLVSQWSSRASAGRGLSSAASQRPRYVPGAIGGHPAVRFDGNDDVLRDTGFQRSATDWTLIVAGAPRSNAGGFRAIFTSNRIGQNDFVSGINLDLGGGPTAAFDVLNLEGVQHEGQCSLKEEPAPFGAHLVTVVRAGGRARLTVDGIAEGERTSRDVPASIEEVRLGARIYEFPAGKAPIERGFLDGDIAEVLFYHAALGDDERAGIESYLLEKYGTAVAEVHEPTIEEAFATLVSYDAAKGRHALGPIDRAIAASHGNSGARNALEERLLAALRSASTADSRDFLCRRLGEIGTARSIPALAPLLTDGRLSHLARVALERIGGPEASGALREALGKTRGKERAGIVDSIGRLGDASAVPLLEGLLAGGDPDAAAAAASGLVRLGAAESLLKLAVEGKGAPAETAAWALIDRAHRLREEGKNEEAARNFRALLKAGPEPVQVAALRGLARAAPAEAVPVLEETARTGSERLRRAAAKILSEK
jgi:type 1 glutamine amidotransferase